MAVDARLPCPGRPNGGPLERPASEPRRRGAADDRGARRQGLGCRRGRRRTWQVASPAGGWPRAGLRCCSSSGVRFMRAPRSTTGSPTSPIRRPGPAEATGPSVFMPRWTGARNRSSRRSAPGSAEPRCSTPRCSSGLSRTSSTRSRASPHPTGGWPVGYAALRALLRRRRGAAGGLRRAGPARRGSRRRRRCGRRRRSRPETRR